MILAALILGIAGAGYVFAAAIVGFSAWIEIVSSNPNVPEDTAIGGAIVEGLSWPATAWQLLTGREADDE